MNFSDMNFSRKFSLNLYKNLKIPMSKMTFTSDFISTVRGDLYPLIKKDEAASERLHSGKYSVCGGLVERLVCSYFPRATYRIEFESLKEGYGGFAFVGPDGARAEIYIESDGWENHVVTMTDGNTSKKRLHRDINDGFALIITTRPHAFDIYIEENGHIEFFDMVDSEQFLHSNRDCFYQKAKAHSLLCGNVTVSDVESYIDCGISQADIRPFRYENGDLITENGRIFLSISSRLAKGGYQSVLSWLPGTADFKMEGAIFYSNHDGAIHGEVAASYVYNRLDGKWHVWVRNGSAGHVLSYACFDYDVRFGVNIIDVNPLPLMTAENLDDRILLGKKGDEDPDFTYDEKRKKWLLALCRIDENTKKYRYFFFESDEPGKNYEFIGCGPAGDETGGSIVRLDNKIYFVCGNDFHAVSDYRVYEWGKFESFTNLKSDYPDGGFRGWATILPVKCGNRYRYFWLTFDRKLLSPVHNWSYGNLYCFEAEGAYEI